MKKKINLCEHELQLIHNTGILFKGTANFDRQLRRKRQQKDTTSRHYLQYRTLVGHSM